MTDDDVGKFFREVFGFRLVDLVNDDEVLSWDSVNQTLELQSELEIYFPDGQGGETGFAVLVDADGNPQLSRWSSASGFAVNPSLVADRDTGTWNIPAQAGPPKIDGSDIVAIDTLGTSLTAAFNPTADDLLQYNGSSWTTLDASNLGDGTSGATELAGLNDVSVGTLGNLPSSGDAGDWYFTSDQNGVYHDPDGSGFDLIAEHPSNIEAGDLAFDPATQAELDSHINDSTNPHGVTSDQVGSPSDSEFDSHVNDTTNPHQVTASQTGGLTPTDHDSRDHESALTSTFGAANDGDHIVKTSTGWSTEAPPTGGGSGTNLGEENANGVIVAWNDQYYNTYDASVDDTIQTIRDDLNANGGGGTVWLPPGGETVVTSGDLGGFSRQHWFCPSEQDQFTVRFTDYANAGLNIDGATADERYCTWENVTFDGDDRSQRNSTPAIEFNTSVPFWNLMGTCDFTEWVDPVIYMNTGHPFESEWHKLYGRAYDGRLIYMTDGGEPLRIRHITAGPENANDPATGNEAKTVMMEYPGGSLFVDTIDHRANKFSPQALHLKVSPADQAYFGIVDWESSYTSGTSVTKIAGGGSVKILQTRTVGQDIDHAYQLTFDNQDHLLGQIQSNSMSFVSKVSVEDDLNGVICYEGPTDEVANNSATSPLSSPVDCWGGNFTG